MHDGQSQLTASTDVSATHDAARRVFFWAGLFSVMVLAGCASKGTRAPVVDISKNPSASVASSSGGYVVKPGDTLYKIARANNVEIDNIKRWNNLTDPNQLVVGQVLKLSASGGSTASSGVQVKPIPSAAAQPRSLDADPAVKPLESDTAAPIPAVAPAALPESHPAPAPDAGTINWGWPAGGKLLQAFNANTKGIDIDGTSGDPVAAAADGKVMYSGNGVRGLGNLIIINHQNGFITAYAHNRALLVKTGQEVKRGAKIAEIGDTDATSPRLHFEVRRQGTPVDPMRYLPPR